MRDPFNLPLQPRLRPYHLRSWNDEHADRHLALLAAARLRVRQQREAALSQPKQGDGT